MPSYKLSVLLGTDSTARVLLTISFWLLTPEGSQDRNKRLILLYCPKLKKPLMRPTLFFLSIQIGKISGDENITSMLRQSGAAVLLVANKIDGQDPDYVSENSLSLVLVSRSKFQRAEKSQIIITR